LVRLAGVSAGDLVVDVGAGTGGLTAAAARQGARVLAVELHPARVAALRARFEGDGRVRVVCADAADLRLPGRPFKVVANPPFAISASVVRRLTSRRSRLVGGALVLPDWSVARWCRASSGRFVLSPGPSVPRGAFSPPAPSSVRTLVIRT
jgi:23S rRNA (adenine-N6)-dimethyltransferase